MPSIAPKIRSLNSKGQSLIEFVTLITLVIGGIIIMGPYVIRSWNANLKGWEDSVQMSQQEQLIRGTGPDIIAKCECKYIPACDAPACCVTNSCTAGETCPECCGVGGCDFTQKTLEIYVCDPLHCEYPPKPSNCVDEPTCCKIEPTNICGANASPPCAPGEMQMKKICKEGTTYFCQRNSACDYKCLNLDGNGTFCYPDYEVGLTQNLTVTHYKFGQCPPNPPNQTADKRCAAFCPKCWVVVNNQCKPPQPYKRCSRPSSTTDPECDFSTATYPADHNSCAFCDPGDIVESVISEGSGCCAQDGQPLHGVTLFTADQSTICGPPGRAGCWAQAARAGNQWGVDACKALCQSSCISPCLADSGFPDTPAGKTVWIGCDSMPWDIQYGGWCYGNTSRTCNASGLWEPPDLSGCVHSEFCGGAWACWCPPPDGSTPYLFTYSSGQYYIEDDVMETYWDQHHERSKKFYEENNPSNDGLQFRPTDFYKLRINPQPTEEGLKLLLKELEPEESYIDQIQLLRIIHPRESSIIIDHESQKIRAIEKEKFPESIVSCTFNSSQDCRTKLNKIDDQSLEGNIGDKVVLQIDVSKTKAGESYLILNSWGSLPPPLQKTVLGASGCSDSLKITIIDSRNMVKKIAMQDVHPRKIESSTTIYLGDILKDIHGDTLQLEIEWTAHHFIDYVGIMETSEVSFKVEKLPLKAAIHSEEGDVLSKLLKKDKIYAHTVRGDQIALTFQNPSTPLKDTQKESYVFVSSGFYHGLRTFLYPNIDATDSFKKEIEEYVNQLNQFLGNSFRHSP